ncbi:hypothetical protein V8E51_008871 [Hyaloscypha variabilis]
MESSSSTPRAEGSGRRLPPVLCKQCKRRQMPWKGTSPRIKPYEKADNTCEHQSGSGPKPKCLKCYTHLQKDDFGFMGCPDPGCKGLIFIAPPIPFTPMPPPLSLDVPVEKPEISKKFKPPLILRTHCRSCRVGNELCSGLISGPRCNRCESLDLECDCKVLRKACEECMKDRGNVDWKRCAGFRDQCDACIEKGIECKEYVRDLGKGVDEEKRPREAVADGKMDIVDGMKAVRAFAACDRCLEEKLRCDESLRGCGCCREKGVECKYMLLAATFSGFPARRLEQRRSSLSRQEKPEEESPEEVAHLRSKILLACGGCRKSKTRCSGILPCENCEKLGIECTPPPRIPSSLTIAGRADAANREAGDSTETGNQTEKLESMMSELELAGWQIISREDVEDMGQWDSDSE